MATLRQRMLRKNTSNVYDTIHLESESSLVLRPNGTNVEDQLTTHLPKTTNSDNNPVDLLSLGEMRISPNGLIFARGTDQIAVFQGSQVYRWAKYNTVSTTIYTWSKYSIRQTPTLNSHTSRTLPQTMSSTSAGGGELANGDDARRCSPLVGIHYIQSVDNYDSPNFNSLINVDTSGNITFKSGNRQSNSCLSSITLFRSVPSASRLQWAAYSGDYFILVTQNYGIEIDYDLEDYTNPTLYSGKYLCNIEFIRNTDSPYVSTNKMILHFYSYTVQQSQGSLVQSGIQSTDQNLYPTNGVSDGYWYKQTGSTVQYSQGTFIENVNSIDPSAYPANGRHADGYWYVKI